MMSALLAKIRSEPAIVAALVSAGLAAAANYGFKLSTDQIAAIWAAVSLILGQVVRASVTPTPNLPTPFPPIASGDLTITTPAQTAP
jgi:hypothetical protein